MSDGFIEAGASVHGVIKGQQLSVAGTVVGQVVVQRLHILEGGRVHGQVQATHIEVQGRLHGQAETKSLSVGEGGQVDAEVQADSVVISGTVSGRVHASAKIELTPTADAQCDLQAPELVVARGAKLRGGLGTLAPAADTRVERDPSEVPHPELLSEPSSMPTPSVVPSETPANPPAATTVQKKRRRRILVKKRR